MNKGVMDIVKNFADSEYARYSCKQEGDSLIITKTPIPKRKIADYIVGKYTKDNNIKFLYYTFFNHSIVICLYYDRKTVQINTGYVSKSRKDSSTIRISEAIALLKAMKKEIPKELL